MTLSLWNALGMLDQPPLKHGFGGFMPTVDVHEANRSYVVEVDLPGIAPDQVDVEVDGNNLIVRGERRQEFNENEQGRHRTERVYGRFERVVTLPASVDPDSIAAGMENGVLRITVPKPQQQTRHVTIESTGGQQQQTLQSR
jgi:HSP20 family molecular chaperone IbpA